MNIVKWILGHPLVAIWVLGAIAILLAMDSGSKKHEVVDDSHAVNSEIASTENTVKNHEVSTVIPLPEKDNSPKQKISNEIEQVAAAVPAVMQVSSDNNVKLQNQPEPFKSAAIEDAKKPAEKTAEVAEDLGQLEIDELLLMAREAYWNNGLDEAAQIYQQLIKREPEVIEHKGELGNVYWRQGYPKKAAELYSEIAIPLIESGSSDRVSNMLGFIQLFYPDRVDVIRERLEQSNK
jgi:tetratricopeptide (TPR) repeat protein